MLYIILYTYKISDLLIKRGYFLLRFSGQVMNDLDNFFFRLHSVKSIDKNFLIQDFSDPIYNTLFQATY